MNLYRHSASARSEPVRFPVNYRGHVIEWDPALGAYAVGDDMSGPVGIRDVYLHTLTIDGACLAIDEVLADLDESDHARACELCGKPVEGPHYSASWCNEVGVGVMLHRPCAIEVEGVPRELAIARLRSNR